MLIDSPAWIIEMLENLVNIKNAKPIGFSRDVRILRYLTPIMICGIRLAIFTYRHFGIKYSVILDPYREVPGFILNAHITE